MPLDPLAKRFLVMMAAASPRQRSPIQRLHDRRQALQKMMQLARAEAAEHRRRSTARCRARPAMFPIVCTPPPAIALGLLPGFVFFHGGGMVAGSIETHDRYVRSACASDRLSPGIGRLPARARAQISGGRSRMRSRPPNGCPGMPRRSASMPTRIVVGGDSAGATLGRRGLPGCAHEMTGRRSCCNA